LGAGKLQSETPLHRGVARAKFDQQLGKALRAEGFEVFPIQRLFRGHVLIPLGRLRLQVFQLNI
jgi:hypothetical protein